MLFKALLTGCLVMATVYPHEPDLGFGGVGWCKSNSECAPPILEKVMEQREQVFWRLRAIHAEIQAAREARPGDMPW